MFSLTFTGPDGSEQTAQLEAELSVGREEGNDLVLPDSAISRRHCRFYIEGDQVVVEDLGSANGVTVDGSRIEGPTAISASSEVFLGEWGVRVASGKPSRVSPKRQGMDGPTGERPARGNGSGPARPTRQLPAKPNRALAKPDAAPAIERGTRRLPAAQNQSRKAPLANPAGPAPRAGSIKGTAGPWTGKTFQLARPVTVIGRTAPADIVVDDDSVSRRHVELRKTPEGFQVRDLGSANGVSVNGEPVSEALLLNGDEVKLGVVTFTYSGPGPAKRGLPPKKKKLFIFVGAGVAFLLAIVVVAVAAGGKTDKPDLVVAPQTDDGVAGMLSLCKLYTDTESNELDWQHGIDNCGKVLKTDPLNVEATKLLKLAKREQEMEKTLAAGKKAFELGHDEEAVEKFLQIDPSSYYFRRARAGFQDARLHITKVEESECKTWSFNGRDWCAAQEHCAKWLDYNCFGNNKNFEDYKKRFDYANKICSKPMEWKCPDRLKRLMDLGGEVADPEQIMRGLLQTKYRNPKIVEVMLGYAMKGNARKAADDLKRFRVTPEGSKLAKDLEPIINDLEIVDGRYHDGTTQATLKPDAALARFQEAFEADGRLMPPNQVGEISRLMRSELSQGYYKKAKALFEVQRVVEAAPLAFKAYEQNPANTDVIELVNKIEQASDDYVNRGCPGLATARQLLRPNNPKMNEVKERWEKLHCKE
jgi:ABC transport system ATP-binding/permease protein